MQHAPVKTSIAAVMHGSLGITLSVSYRLLPIQVTRSGSKQMMSMNVDGRMLQYKETLVEEELMACICPSDSVAMHVLRQDFPTLGFLKSIVDAMLIGDGCKY